MFIRVNGKKPFWGIFKAFSLAQNTLKSYHKWPKSRFNLQGSVNAKKFISDDKIFIRRKVHGKIDTEN